MTGSIWIASESGVVFSKTELKGPDGSALSTKYRVTSRRTPEEWVFDGLDEGLAAYEAEVERCRRAPPPP